MLSGDTTCVQYTIFDLVQGIEFRYYTDIVKRYNGS